ncbi:lipid-binding SYLF domain-containing protein [Bradyrhizobium sp. LB5.2]
MARLADRSGQSLRLFAAGTSQAVTASRLGKSAEAASPSDKPALSAVLANLTVGGEYGQYRRRWSPN